MNVCGRLKLREAKVARFVINKDKKFSYQTLSFYLCTTLTKRATLRTAADGIETGASSMVQNIVNSINNWQDWHAFCRKVFASKTYEHGWFVYADCFNEGESRPETILGKGLTEAEAKAIYEANKYAVEHNGTDYAEIYMENLYQPSNWSSSPFVYARATGEDVPRAFELFKISQGVHAKFEKMGLYF